MSEQRVLSVTEPTPCFVPENRDIFDAVIDLSDKQGANESTRRRRRNTIEAAKRICGGCPEREQCLEVHGRDLALGVVAGASDGERAEFFGDDEATA